MDKLELEKEFLEVIKKRKDKKGPKNRKKRK